MRAQVMAGLLALVAAVGPAEAACPPELLQKMIDQGYTRAEVLRLCGEGGGAGSASGTSSRVDSAFAQLRALSADLDRRCERTSASNPQGTGPCDLSRQYRQILAQWERGQQKCAGGDANACEVLEQAADQFFAGLR